MCNNAIKNKKDEFKSNQTEQVSLIEGYEKNLINDIKTNTKEIISKYQTPKFFDILEDKNNLIKGDMSKIKDNKVIHNNKDYKILCKPHNNKININGKQIKREKENISNNENNFDFKIINYKIKDPLQY